MKLAILTAHDAIIAARVKQTQQANQHRREVQLKEGSLVYLSTKNLALPKGRSRKLVPKFIGPYRVIKEVEKGASYKLDLPTEMMKRGLHPVFHVSKLRIHQPNDDRLFPGRQLHQLPGFGVDPTEWEVDRILSHTGRGSETLFQLKWKSGDITWARLADVKHLVAYSDYMEAMGAETVSALPPILGEHVSGAKKVTVQGDNKPFHYKRQSFVTSKPRHGFPTTRMPAELTKEQSDDCKRYAAQCLEYCKGRGPHPGVCPERWFAYRDRNPGVLGPEDKSEFQRCYSGAPINPTQSSSSASSSEVNFNMPGELFRDFLETVSRPNVIRYKPSQSVAPHHPYRPRNHLRERIGTGKSTDWIPDDVWRTMSPAEKRIAKQDTKRRRTRNGANAAPKPSPDPLPTSAELDAEMDNFLKAPNGDLEDGTENFGMN